jgi:hypothetical protein
VALAWAPCWLQGGGDQKAGGPQRGSGGHGKQGAEGKEGPRQASRGCFKGPQRHAGTRAATTPAAADSRSRPSRPRSAVWEPGAPVTSPARDGVTPASEPGQSSRGARLSAAPPMRMHVSRVAPVCTCAPVSGSCCRRSASSSCALSRRDSSSTARQPRSAAAAGDGRSDPVVPASSSSCPPSPPSARARRPRRGPLPPRALPRPRPRAAAPLPGRCCSSAARLARLAASWGRSRSSSMIWISSLSSSSACSRDPASAAAPANSSAPAGAPASVGCCCCCVGVHTWSSRVQQV